MATRMASFILLSLAMPVKPDVPAEWREAMDTLSQLGAVEYRRFVYETPGFIDYWQQATPINELARMPIGSRPAKRSKGGFESVRAIPWMFSWMQSRAIIPSWYGVGTALETFCNQRGLDLLRTMCSDGHFGALVRMMNRPHQSRYGIAGCTLLVDDERYTDHFSGMQAEHACCDFICKI
jgi:phosphoenolpyruvate carboxylase